MIASEPASLSWEVVQRLYSLKKMESHIGKGKTMNDKNILANIKGIQKAYRSGELEWYGDSRITVWQKGKLLCGPIAVSNANFKELYDKYQDREGLWVEGVC